MILENTLGMTATLAQPDHRVTSGLLPSCREVNTLLAVPAAQDTQTVVLRPVLWMFIGLLVTFMITRSITRYIRAGADREASLPVRDITVGGVHIHHQVFGIVIMLGAGLVLISTTPEGVALNAAAAVFGVGVSLTFDEFALWLHLKDVYWTNEGRQSVDAIFCVLAVTGILIGGADLLTGRVGSATWWNSVVVLAVNLVLSIICLLKGKVITGIVGVFFLPVAIIGAIRLAKPGSWWARRRYPRRPHRLGRAERRFGPAYQARWNRLRDAVGGAPDR
jgi:hypothetical protein